VEPAGTDTSTRHTARLLSDQGRACRELGSPLYGDLLLCAAADLLDGGPTADVLDGYLTEPVSSVLPLRMLGAAHALALTGQAPELAAFYPSAGGAASPGTDGATAWAALRQTLADHRSFVRSWLPRPPQTNEVGRGAALVGGLRHIVAEAIMPVRLVEVGASAGLNLRADHFRITSKTAASKTAASNTPASNTAADSRGYGDPESSVILTDGWQGAAPPESPINVIARTGGDLDPIDPTTPEGRLTLTAYVWPDQIARLERLRGALALARLIPADLRPESATATLARTELADGNWTVLWHSIFRQYLGPAQREELAAGVARLGAAATPSARFAYLYLEQSRTGGCPVTLTTWPGGQRRVLGDAPPHGVPVTWRATPLLR
jgi:hypothetical protein